MKTKPYIKITELGCSLECSVCGKRFSTVEENSNVWIARQKLESHLKSHKEKKTK